MENEDWHIIEIEDDPDLYEPYELEHSIEHKFEPGTIKVYLGAQAIFEGNPEGWREYLARHLKGDYGELDEGDKQANERALDFGDDRLLSRYDIGEAAIYIETWPGYYTSILDVWER